MTSICKGKTAIKWESKGKTQQNALNYSFVINGSSNESVVDWRAPLIGDGSFCLDGNVRTHWYDSWHGISHREAIVLLLPLGRKIWRSIESFDRIEILTRMEMMKRRTDCGASGAGSFAVRRSLVRLTETIKGRVPQFRQGIAPVFVRFVEPRVALW